MRTLFGALLTVFLFLVSLPAHALKISIDNGYDSTANIAIHYLKPNNVWHTEGWFVWQPHEQGFIEVDSNNTLFYIYVEFSDGLVNNTNAGAVTQWVSDTSFSLEAGVKPDAGGRLVEFSLCNSDGHTAVVRLNPSAGLPPAN